MRRVLISVIVLLLFGFVTAIFAYNTVTVNTERAPFMPPVSGKIQIERPGLNNPQSLVQGPVSTSPLITSTWLGGGGTSYGPMTLDNSQEVWFKYIMNSNERIQWTLTSKAGDCDIEINEYKTGGKLGNLFAGSYNTGAAIDNIDFTNTDRDYLYIFVGIKAKEDGSSFDLTGVREPTKQEPIWLSNYAFAYFGFPENGVEGTFVSEIEHWYRWVVPSYYDEFRLQITSVGIPQDILTSGCSLEIWNKAVNEMLGSVASLDEIYPDTTSWIKGYADSILYLNIKYWGDKPLPIEYRIDYNSFMESVPIQEDYVTPNLPTVYGLVQTYPNPFSSAASIQYSVTIPTHIALRVYNIAGNLVRTLVDEKKNSGYYTVCWDGKDDAGRAVISGIYFCRIKVHTDLETRGCTNVKKMIFIR